ncbi:hypothetical protein ACEPAG_8749 [Sanghuangporus baumii]
MANLPQGLPLLSGPPPEPTTDERAEMSCRKCDKEFNILFARGRRCNHCGYSYCYSCSDYQALMPRSGNDAGYDPMHVCAFCIQYLQITAGGKALLRSLPLSKLKNYMQAYGLRVGADVIEKDDIINAIIAARTENGCLPRPNENYYRKHSVPSGQTARPRGFFSRPERTQPPRQYLDPRTGWSHPASFARPDVQQEQPRQAARNQYAPPPGLPPYATYTSPRQSAPSSPYTPQPQFHSYYQRPFSSPQAPPASNVPPNSSLRPSNQNTNPGPSQRPATAPPPQSSQPRPRVPSLDQLLEMQEEEVSSLSIGVLKDILDNNHVRPGLVLEKSELVARVNALLTNERHERVRAEAIREREEWEAQERAWAARERERAAREEREREERERADKEERARRREAYRTTVESVSESDSSQENSPPSGPTQIIEEVASVPVNSEMKEEAKTVDLSRSPSPPSFRSTVERNGLCVVCQDEEANIVVIDCGHLALCRACSDLVWSSTRECPLCRTRIVTQARLLRVFKT